MTVQFFKTDCGVTAYKQTDTGSPVGVFLLPGHRARFDSATRNNLAAVCEKLNLSYTHFTHFGWDQSADNNVPPDGEGYVQNWLQQAFDVFDNLTSGPHIVVGSSMGGYMALAFAQARAERVAGLVGLAAGFGRSLSEKIKHIYGENRVGTATEQGFRFDVNDDGSLPILDKLAIDCPVRLRHAMGDDVVSYRNTDYIAQAVTTPDVMISLTKDGGHQLYRPSDVKWLEETLVELIG